MSLAILGILWHAFAIRNMFLLAPYGKKWEGFYLGLLLGPLGWWIAVILRDELKDKQERSS